MWEQEWPLRNDEVTLLAAQAREDVDGGDGENLLNIREMIVAEFSGPWDTFLMGSEGEKETGMTP